MCEKWIVEISSRIRFVIGQEKVVSVLIIEIFS